jgi:diguanylate cyclase (GGDEF)-like protein
MAVAYEHTTRALAAAIFGDRAGLREHSAAAAGLSTYIGASYSTSTVNLLLALADGPEQHRRTARDWLAARAADAPDNFRHLVHFADAELAWTAGDHHAALRAFDAALNDLGNRCRPWHRALITERAALLHLQEGREFHGRRLLADAHDLYGTWGATAKLRALERAHPFLRTVTPSRTSVNVGHTTTLAAQDVDLMAILTASRALSSETRLDRLRDRVTDILGTLTGASHIRMLVREGTEWVLPAETSLPLTAVRYVQRTREPLLVADAARDDRFARDPYLAGLEFCSLLVIPVLIQGTPLAILVLENRLARAAFTADRLDAVLLIAGQLAVSIENARVYASLEATVAERTEELHRANEQLQILSSTDALTGLANRRQLDTRLATAWHDGAERHEPLSIAMIDVDHFKLYNDRYGHPAGDACLRRVAAALTGVIRTSDLVARYGGEEFALILPGADPATALAIAERARSAVLALTEPHAAAPAGLVTVSIGVASIVPGPDSGPQLLVDSADAELYQAKQHGRNRVMSDAL